MGWQSGEIELVANVSVLTDFSGKNGVRPLKLKHTVGTYQFS